MTEYDFNNEYVRQIFYFYRYFHRTNCKHERNRKHSAYAPEYLCRPHSFERD